MSDDPTIERDEDFAAAEYVLGVLSAHDRRAAEQRLARDPAFANEVAFWEERLAGIAAGVTPVPAPERAWTRIEAALARGAQRQASRGVWNSLAFWRGFALAASALAAACLAGLIYVGSAVSPSPLLARLDAEGGKAGFVAAVNRGDGSLIVVPAALLAPGSQQAFELWLIPPGDKPHSLGLIDPARPVTIRVPRDLLKQVAREAVLAVSVEPPGGSPTGAPTGPVIANGKLASL
jgi:anti-sigma-K factor RskA